MSPTNGGRGRLSLGHFPGQPADDSLTKGRAFLFIRDVPLAIMPYRSPGESDFQASLSPPNDDATRWLTSLLDLSGHRPWSLEDALSDFVREVVGTLAYSGEIHFELVSTPQAETDSLPAVELARLPIGAVLKIGRRYLQVVPPHSRKKIGHRYVSIPAERIWRLRLPAAFGTPRMHKRLVRRLAGISDLIPKFALSQTMGADVAGYDLRTFRLATDAEVEKLTRRWGSIPSLQRIQGTTEYYFFARTLQFRRSEALIREQVITAINELLPRLGVNAQLVVAGLPTSSQIEALMRDLEAGTIDFAEAAAASRTP